MLSELISPAVTTYHIWWADTSDSLLYIAHQYESFDGEEHLKAGVDKERAEQAQAVVTQVFEGQLEDVAPANAAQVNLLCGPIGSTTHSQKLEDGHMLLL